jgi:hypothetical protein
MDMDMDMSMDMDMDMSMGEHMLAEGTAEELAEITES